MQLKFTMCENSLDKKRQQNRRQDITTMAKKTTVVIRFSGLKNKGNSIYGTHFFPPLFFS
jgi:hypothetical protein